MPIGEGIVWDRDPGTDDSNANVEVTVAGSELTGVVRIPIATSDTPGALSTRLANEWNDRHPIATVYAYADPVTKMTAFIPQMDASGNPLNAILGLAVTFDGSARQTLPKNVQVVDSGVSKAKLTRVDVQVQPEQSE